MFRVGLGQGACKLTISLDISSVVSGAVFDAALLLDLLRSLAQVVIKHFGQPEGPEPEGDGAPDLAETDEAPGFARQFCGLQRHLLPSALAHAAVGGNELSLHGQPQGDGVLGDADGICARRIGHRDFSLRTSFEVDVLITDARLLDQLERPRLRQQLSPDAALEGKVSEHDVRFGEGFGKLFFAHVVAGNNVGVGDSRRELNKDLSTSTGSGANDSNVFFIAILLEAARAAEPPSPGASQNRRALFAALFPER